MVSGAAMAPSPTSPHASRLLTTGITPRPRPSSTPSWEAVKGWRHMSVFMAGATSMGAAS